MNIVVWYNMFIQLCLIFSLIRIHFLNLSKSDIWFYCAANIHQFWPSNHHPMLLQHWKTTYYIMTLQFWLHLLGKNPRFCPPHVFWTRKHARPLKVGNYTCTTGIGPFWHRIFPCLIVFSQVSPRLGGRVWWHQVRKGGDLVESYSIIIESSLNHHAIVML